MTDRGTDNIPSHVAEDPNSAGATLPATGPAGGRGGWWLALLVSILGGLLFSLPFRQPEWAWLQWLSVLPLFWAIRRRSPDQAFWLGWFYGLAATVFGYDHLVGTIVRFGRFNVLLAEWMPSLASHPAVIDSSVTLFGSLILLLFAALTAVSFALFAWLTRRITPRWNPLLVAAIWTAIELIYPNLFPRTIANTQYLFLPFIQAADLGGVALLNFLMVWVQAALFRPLVGEGEERLRPLAHLGLAAAVLGAALLYGYWRIDQVKELAGRAPAMKIGTIQPNIQPREIMDMSPENQNKLLKLEQQLSDPLRDVDLVVWPESARLIWYPDGLVDTTQNFYLERGYFPYPELGKPLLFGALGYTPDPANPARQLHYFNRNILISAKGQILGWFDKHILMPFGETMPLATIIPAIRKLSPATTLLTPGASLAPLRMENGTQLGAMSCYEDMIAPVPRAMVQSGAQVLLVLLNDNWFGPTAAPYQHMMLSLFRTVELRRYLVRCTNTGVSVIAAPWGEIVAQVPAFTTGINRGEVHLLDGWTVYARYGEVFGWACVAATGIGLGLSFFRRRNVE